MSNRDSERVGEACGVSLLCGPLVGCLRKRCDTGAYACAGWSKPFASVLLPCVDVPQIESTTILHHLAPTFIGRYSWCCVQVTPQHRRRSRRLTRPDFVALDEALDTRCTTDFAERVVSVAGNRLRATMRIGAHVAWVALFRFWLPRQCELRCNAEFVLWLLHVHLRSAALRSLRTVC